MPRLLVIALLNACLLTCSWARAENWPGWRGPRGDGSSMETQVPTQWDGPSGKNIAWKVPIPGVGHASPIVWQDRVFVASCVTDQLDRVLMCLDRRSGKTLWRKSVVKAPLETKHSLNSFASSTPVTDGKHVIVTFLKVGSKTIPARNVGRSRPVTPGQMVVAAYDMQGHRKWMVEPGTFVSVHGFCSSPILYKDLVIVNGDHDGNSYLVALNAETGQTVWKVPREHKTRSYVTPIIRTIDGRTQMIVSGSRCIVSFDPSNGKRYWSIDGPTEQFVASPVFNGTDFFMAAGFPTHHVMAIRPTGSGDVTQTHVHWHVKNAKCYVPSPVLVGQHLFVADDRGTANCFHAQSGDRLWQDRLGRHYSASLVTAGGLVYFLADDGITKLVRPGKTLDVVAENKLGEFCYASPAISQGQILVRGERNLYCIGSVQTSGD